MKQRSAPPAAPQHVGRVSGTAWMLLAGFLVVPTLALTRLGAKVDGFILAGGPLAMSLFMFLLYRSDKRRAEAGGWRIPESTLHLGELMGGWPGAFLAQRYYRHKTAKLPYQIGFWMIVLLYEYVALDFLLGWKLARALGELSKAQIA